MLFLAIKCGGGASTGGGGGAGNGIDVGSVSFNSLVLCGALSDRVLVWSCVGLACVVCSVLLSSSSSLSSNPLSIMADTREVLIVFLGTFATTADAGVPSEVATCVDRCGFK